MRGVDDGAKALEHGERTGDEVRACLRRELGGVQVRESVHGREESGGQGVRRFGRGGGDLDEGTCQWGEDERQGRGVRF
jgi:hypothetical protein